VVEVGCGTLLHVAHTMCLVINRPHLYAGAGNAIFPLLAQNCNPELRIHAFDYSSHAIKLVQVRFNLYLCYIALLSPTCCWSAKCSVHITTLWSDHGRRLGLIIHLAASRPCAAFG